jgi:GMP synthase (glutamine-hydrolysing)
VSELLSNTSHPPAQIVVLDAGGQYCHLIARKVRELGVYAEVKPSEAAAASLRAARGVIISGGPGSVYDEGSPRIDRALLHQGIPVLGICYGLQLMAYQLAGSVQRGEKGEYGFARLAIERQTPLFRGLSPNEQVWMSHRDLVRSVPPGFEVLASTATCPIAAMANPDDRLYGVQFHPEVAHSPRGRQVLSNFVFDICGCEKDWDPRHRVQQLEEQIRAIAGDRNVFFFVSGGVDSAVAYALCLQALGPERTTGLYVDTGLMRKGETEFVRRVFDAAAPGNLEIEYAQDQFLAALTGVIEPEEKRRIIGEEFVKVQERILSSHHFLDGHWILGQGTIYPDTIESGGTANASVIKTHHNRVPGIQCLIEKNCLIEPLTSFYKDEVREIGRELGLPSELLDRHPFPGPGLAIRCLCSAERRPAEPLSQGWLIPVHSVGVQGDCRSYQPVLAIDHSALDGMDPHERATVLINRHSEINRVVMATGRHAPLEQMEVMASALDPERLNRLREADAIVRSISHESGYDSRVWQFPVILIPLGVPARPDSVVLRPVDSVDGMTAQAVAIEPAVLAEMTRQLMALDGIAAVFCDLTHKPPGTIEWE